MIQHSKSCRDKWSMEIQVCTCGAGKANRELKAVDAKNLDLNVQVERLRTLLRETYRFIDSYVYYSQPAPDMGPEPSDQFSHEAPEALRAIQAALGQSHDEILKNI